MGLFDYEYGGQKKSIWNLFKDLAKTAKNNPRNSETMESVFGGLGIVPGVGDVASGAEAAYRYKQGDMLGAGLAGLGALPLVPNVAGMFIGKGAKTWDAVKASQAMEMADKGIDPRTIWKETGNWKAPDGKWRQEIPDNAAKHSKEWMWDYETKPVSNAIKHDDLFRAYPSLSDTKIRLSPSGQQGASFNPDTNIIEFYSGNKSDAAASMNLHELQHAIQQREGWARGGSPEEMARLGKQAQDEYDLLWQTMQSNPQNKDKIIPELDALRSRYRDFASPNDAYRRLAGEAEARATQARMNLDMNQRLNLFPEDSYDVPINQLIIRGLLNE